MSRPNNPAHEPGELLDILTADAIGDQASELREAAAAIAFENLPAPPPERLRSRLMQAVKLEPRVAASGEAGWIETGQPGVRMKLLYQDPDRSLATLLLRMEPGASYPAHFHTENEQCYVIEGDVRWRDLVYRQGDFVVAPKGSIHPPITTETGNLLLLVAGRNELRLEYEG